MLFRWQLWTYCFLTNLNRSRVPDHIWLVFPPPLAEPVVEVVSPCEPSPCGANAICKESNGVGSCLCLPDYYGNPYESCRPECVSNSECSPSLACVRNKCTDPCPGVCGTHAQCHVINHVPQCTCDPGFTGNAYQLCSAIPLQSRKFDFLFCLIRSM